MLIVMNSVNSSNRVAVFLWLLESIVIFVADNKLCM